MCSNQYASNNYAGLPKHSQKFLGILKNFWDFLGMYKEYLGMTGFLISGPDITVMVLK